MVRRQGKIATAGVLAALAAMLAVGAPSASAIPTVKSTFVFTKVEGDRYTGKVKSSVAACVRNRTVIFKRGATTIATKTSSRNGTVVLTAQDQAATPFELAHVAMPKMKIGGVHKRFCSADDATIDKRGDEKPVVFNEDDLSYQSPDTFLAQLESPEPQCISGRGAQLYRDNLYPMGGATSTAAGGLSVTTSSSAVAGSYRFQLTDSKRWVKITGGGDVNSGPCESLVSSGEIVLA